MNTDRFKIVFSELEKNLEKDEYSFELEPIIEYSDEIYELQRLSEELQQPQYQVVSSTRY
ncbi:hypothetical protein [Oceanobacillus damuensis]|uniref:hypothetical protein n=1 Tax=Oceanobacillus damuensis TaxID=937928 RepID=UPI000835D895|nr:hypothetical protein [Oceanobacillus damuensis]